jgi:hypothetical protein
MSPNGLGKLLVLINLAAAMLFMTFAGAIFLQKVDWGWKEPRKDITGSVRIPSEIDQRNAAVKEAHKAVALVMSPLQSSEKKLAEVEPRFPDNHRWYIKEIDRLRNDPADKIDIKDFVIGKDGRPELDPKPSGRPKQGNPIAGLNKSYQKYAADLKALHEKIGAVDADIRSLIDTEEKLTFKLNGKDKTGKVVEGKYGLYTLLENEAREQNKAKFEKEYLLPRWVGALGEVRSFQERRKRLDETIEKLKKDRGVQ